MKIEILFFKDCPNYEEAYRRIRVVLAELGQDAEVVLVEVPDDTTAARVRFPGSPTIRVDGKDIVPEESTGPYGLSCRVYSTASGVSGVPEMEAIRRAMLRNVE
jgi:hypothetical protein